MSKTAFDSALKIVLPDGQGPIIVEGDGIEVEFRDGKIHVRSGDIASTPTEQTLSSTTCRPALKVGDVVADGPNKGWIYCETKEGDVFLVAPKDGGVMQWYEAVDFARQQKAELPSREQLCAMYDARNTGALNETFNITGCRPAGWYWGTNYNYTLVRHQNFLTGFDNIESPRNQSSVRCVRKVSVI